MLEYEKKLMITRNEFDTLLNVFCKNDAGTIQTNYYFDTEDFSMNKNGITCRIRAKKGEYTACIKHHNFNNKECSIEENIAEELKFKPEIFESLGLMYQGLLISERHILYQDNICKMTIDFNVFLGIKDYELEVEYLENNEEQADRLIEMVADVLEQNKTIIIAFYRVK